MHGPAPKPTALSPLANPMTIAAIIQAHNSTLSVGRGRKRPRKRLNMDSAVRRSLVGAKGLR